MDEIQIWRNRIAEIYRCLPDRFKNYKWYTIFKSIAVDYVLLIDVIDGSNLSPSVENALRSIERNNDADKIEECLNRLKEALDDYYLNRRDTGRWEAFRFGFLKDRSFPYVFVLSYNRWGKNYTLDRIETWNDPEAFSKTTVFVQKDQEEKYRVNHPRFNYHAQNVDTVGERMMAVLEFCRKKGIKRAVILEDEIINFYHIKKGGVEKESKLCPGEENLGSAYMKYFADLGDELMKQDEDLVLLGMRNRTMAQNESTSIIGHHEPMRGGCPNLAFYIDVERFYPVYKKIPKEHYSPQYDWALQSAIVSSRKHWVMVTGIAKDEHVGKSVIGFTGDREPLAKEMIDYYGVGDSMTYRRFKNTELQGVKIFYNKHTKERIDELF